MIAPSDLPATAAALLFGLVSGLIGAATAIAVWEAGGAMVQKCHTSR
jgi:hypothetical protein